MEEPDHRIYRMSMKDLYPAYVHKAERKGRTKAEVDQITTWLTGYGADQIDELDEAITVKEFFTDAPALNPDRELITGVVCGVRVEEVEQPTMRLIRYLDKLIDELAKGKAMEKILRTPKPADV